MCAVIHSPAYIVKSNVPCRSIREIRRDMHKQREWRNELEKMKIGNVVGSLSVESKTLRASLIPVTQRTLEQVGP